MSATRKLYVELAETVRLECKYRDEHDCQVIREVIGNIMLDLKRDNSNFKPERFLAACGFDR